MRRFLAATIAVVLAAGCGGDEESNQDDASSAGAQTQSGDTAGTRPQVPAGGAASGEEERAELPEGFPAYPNATSVTPDEGVLAQWETDDALPDVAEYYAEQLDQDPWRVFEHFSATVVAQSVVFREADGQLPVGTLSLVTHEDLRGTIIKVTFN